MIKVRKRKRNILSLFKRKSDLSSAKTYKRKIRRRRITSGFVRFIIFAVILAVVAYLGWNSINYVINLRLSKLEGENINYERGFVAGFDSIPEYPGSKFIFENYITEDHVREFLSGGNSVYRLPPNTNFSEVVEYYNKEMPLNKWEHILSVPLESEEMKYGEYWIKNDSGVRIYSKLNDIWYENVSKKDAKTGKSAEVKQEVERELLLLTTESFDLRPDFPWRLKVPSEYLVSYSGTEIGELQQVEFKKIGSSKSVLLKPLGYIGAFTYDSFLDNFLSEYSKITKQSWYVVNSVVTTVSGQEAVQAVLTSGSNSGEAYIVGNPRNDVVYIIASFEEGNPLLKYIVEKISPTDSSY